MMPSVIPARLQYRCGHAALVTLPRVKGETATQRNQRVAREKSAALLRECDFCAPANGTNHLDAAPATVETAPVLEIAVPVVEVVTEPVAEALAAVAAEPATDTVAEALPEAPASAAAIEVAETEPQPHARPMVDGVAAPKPARKPRVRRQPAPSAAELARGRRFLVEYRVERVLRANTIRDALRQVASFGPADVVAITRED